MNKDKYIENILTKSKSSSNSNNELESTFFSDDSFLNLNKQQSISIDDTTTSSINMIKNEHQLRKDDNTLNIKLKNRNNKKTTSLMKTTLSYKLLSKNISDISNSKDKNIKYTNKSKDLFIGHSCPTNIQYLSRIKKPNNSNSNNELLHKSLPNYLEKDCKLMDIILCDHNIDDDEISHRLLILEDKLDKLEQNNHEIINQNNKIIEQNNDIMILLNNINETIKEQEDIYLTSSFISFSEKKNKT